MSSFEKKLDSLFNNLGVSLYQIGLSLGEDSSRLDKILYNKRPTTFDKRLEAIVLICQSPLLKGKVKAGTLAQWLSEDYISEEGLEKAFERANSLKLKRMPQ
jgi:hypothetical protein